MGRLVPTWLKVALVLLVAVAGFVAFNSTYLHRYVTFFHGDRVRQVDWFSPTAVLTPAPDAVDLVSTGTPDIFGAALDYAAEMNTSALLVSHKGEVVLEHYAQGYSSDSATQTNSVHKSVLALLVGIAVDNGAIGSIDDPVSRYLGNWIDEPYGEITVQHLLTMSSGLVPEPAMINLFDPGMRLMHAKDISAVAQSVPQQRAPFADFDYTNVNAQLLVDLLESATGESYEKYLADNLWSKLAQSPGALWMDRDDGTPHGFCCLIAQPSDLLRLGLLVLQQGNWHGEQLVSKEWVSQMMTPSAANPNFGYLLWLGSPHQEFRGYSLGGKFGALHSEPYLADDVYFFDGFGGQRVYIIPSRELVIVRVGETRFDYDDAILPNRIMQATANLQATGSTKEAAPHAAEVMVLDRTISAAHRDQIAVRYFYPRGGSGRYPLIAFSHGNSLSNVGYQVLAEAWVANGYIVAAPKHLDSGSRAEVNALSDKLGSDWITASRVLDVRAAIDSMASATREFSDFSGSVQTDRVIAAGHSAGALTAQLAAGATQERLGNSSQPIPTDLADERVVAVVALSSPGEIPGLLSKQTWRSLQAPQLVVTGTADTFEFLWPRYTDHFVAYESAQSGNNYLLVVDKMDHYMGNLLGRPERDSPPQKAAFALVLDVAHEFMRTYLSLESAGQAPSNLARHVAALDQSLIQRFDHR